MSTRHSDMTAALAICIIANQPVVLWGKPGQGKTSIVEAIARDLGLHMETIIASIREPSDFAGLPVTTDYAVDSRTGRPFPPKADADERMRYGKNRKVVELAPPVWAQRLFDAEEGIAFYDEISTAPPAVQAAMLRPILEGWVGDLQLPVGVRTIAAANPPEMAADGWDLAPPMANRFTHLDWGLDVDTVREGFSVGWPTFTIPDPDPAVVAKALKETMIILGAFLGTRQDLLTNMPNGSAAQGRAFATPRSWESAARLYAVAQACGANETVITTLLSGTVGQGAANEFIQFITHLDLPDPEDLLKNPESLVIDRSRTDKTFAIAASVWAATQGNNTPERWGACGDVLARIAEAQMADIAFLYGRYWAKARPEGGYPTKLVVKHLAPILNEMGILNKKMGASA